jgi:hypothetical protein
MGCLTWLFEIHLDQLCFPDFYPSHQLSGLLQGSLVFPPSGFLCPSSITPIIFLAYPHLFPQVLAIGILLTWVWGSSVLYLVMGFH